MKYCGDGDAAILANHGIATNVPKWIPENCIGCNMCSLVCPHACIRPFLVTVEEKAAAPEGMGKAIAGK